MSHSSPSEPCQLLPWDTAFFGVTIARVRAATLTADAAERIDLWCRQHSVACLYLAAKSDDPSTALIAQDRGYRLVDVRMTFERAALPAPHPLPAQLRQAGEPDIPALRHIARAAHRDTRYFADPHFAPAQAAALYETWIENSCRGFADVVLVGEHAGQPAGYITCSHKPDSAMASIGLSAVADGARGRGLGRMLVDAALCWSAQRSATRVSVVTQARNIAAQRLYQKCGFVTRSVELFFHKWYPGDPR